MTTDYTPWTPDMPMVTVTITEPDDLSVKVFNIDYAAPIELLPLRRASFGALMDHLYDRLRQPFTVEIIETDGTSRNGTIDLGEQTTVAAPPPCRPRRMLTSPTDPAWGTLGETAQPHLKLPLIPAPSQRSDTGTEPSAPVYLNGYEPGEEACIAFVVAATTVTADGEASFQVPRRVLESLPSGEVVVLGRSSGKAVVVEPLLGR